MQDDNTTNLPILDDIIKAGDTDKAVALPSRKMKSSAGPVVETGEPSAADASAENDSHTAIDTRSDIAELFTEDQSRISQSTESDAERPVIEPEPSNQPFPASGDIRQPAVNLTDLDAITNEILAEMMPELEQMLRKKIRQTLNNRISGKNGSD